jgi:N-methylhydantoinase B
MIDPVTQEILSGAFSSIAEEMAVVEYRSSYSPIIREMLDFSCGVFDAAGRLIAHSEMIPAQLGLMQSSLQQGLAKHHPDGLRRGDVMLTNHPYLGGTHTPDLQVFRPVYAGRALVGYAGSIAHHIDVGGRVPGTESAENTELYQEGLLFPALLLVERGRRVRPIWQLIEANVRDPYATLGDLAAQISALRRGEQRLLELAERYGVETLLAGIDGLLEQTSQRTRAEFASWPRREVVATGYMDDDGVIRDVPLTITARLWTTDDGELHVDLDASSAQSPGGINVPWASSHAAVYFGVRAFCGSAVPQNDGLTRHVHLHCGDGSLLRPRFPAAVSTRHIAVQRLTDVVVEALGDLLGARAVAAAHVSFPTFVIQATDPRNGRVTILTDILGGGGGARPLAPGDAAIDSYTSNCALLPAEIAELEYPWRIERTELVEGSGGAGAQPGGAGMLRDYTLLADDGYGIYYVEQTNPAFAARGRDGGGPGAPGAILLRRAGSETFEQLPGKGEVRMRRGDTLRLLGAGGGGYGLPASSDRH